MIDELISACFSEFCDIAGDSLCGCDACLYGRTNDDCYAIYEHDKLTTLEKKGITPLKWIPVTERLPEKEALVLIICKNGARFVGFYNRFHDGINWGIKTALNSTRWLNNGRVTHWMPLPEPPQEET